MNQEEKDKFIEEYNKRNDLLELHYEQISAFEFYREVFPEGSFSKKGNVKERKPNGIMTLISKDEETPHKGYDVLFFDELEDLTAAANHPMAITSCIGYSGKRRIKDNAYTLFGMTFDIDDVGEQELKNLIGQIEAGLIPWPTFITNSGGGVHLYYILDEPEPMQHNKRRSLDALKRGLTDVIANSNVTSKKQEYQGLYQGYRMPGSLTKAGEGYPVIAYKTGNKISINELNDFVDDDHKAVFTTKYTLEEAKKLFPDWWERKINNGTTNNNKSFATDSLYYWWITTIYERAHKGNRYFCLVCLFVYAVKCGIPRDVVYQDAMSAVKEFNRRFPEDPFTEDDVNDAASYYNEDSMMMRRETISRLTGIEIKANKRNLGEKHRYRSKRKATLAGQKCALEENAWAVRDAKYPNGSWRKNSGRPRGSSAQRDEIVAWREIHTAETDTPKACAEELGISLKTVRRWWDAEYDSAMEKALSRSEEEIEKIQYKRRHQTGGRMLQQTGLSPEQYELNSNGLPVHPEEFE